MTGPDKTDLSIAIKRKVHDLGFDMCGIASAKDLKENRDVLKSWCNAGMNGQMAYLSRNMEKRSDPGLLFPGARSLVVTGMSYYRGIRQVKPGVPIISRYAYGTNYHDVIIKKLDCLLAFVKSLKKDAEGRSFVDSAPLLEKAWAQEAGLGWQGKHSVIINKKAGSFFFIGTLILNIELDYDKSYGKDFCGDCRLCIDACPTGAINENRTINAGRCLANLTIENREPVPAEFKSMMKQRVFGCDLCQEACPWNRNAPVDLHSEFDLPEEIAEMSADDWMSLSKEQFDRLFGRSSVGRVKYENLIQNISLIMRS